MNKVFGFILLCMLFVSCKREYVKISGQITNIPDLEMSVKIKSFCGEKLRVLDTVEIKKGKFQFYSDEIKPPVKLTFAINDQFGFDVWIGTYGKMKFVADAHELESAKIIESFFNDELQRVQLDMYEMYIAPLNEKIKWADSVSLEIEKGENVCLKDYETMQDIKQEINKAERLRVKSIMKTLRKNKKSAVACAFAADEYQQLSKKQQADLIRCVTQCYSDTGMGWQLRN